MALKFLNKKGWHTGSLQNIENVWKAEQKHDAEQRKLEELRKQIQDEHEKSELRLRQEQAGLVPLDFLYESGLAVGNGSSDGFKALQAPPAAASTTSTSEASSSKFLPLSTKRTANSFATDGLPLELLLLLYAAFAVVVAIVRSFSRCLRKASLFRSDGCGSKRRMVGGRGRFICCWSRSGSHPPSILVQLFLLDSGERDYGLHGMVLSRFNLSFSFRLQSFDERP
ncbi:hypothetical protein GW17_00054525 [Ensete ventricosum]|nr:hypothetical protein GW17_00054525 [Ensete ventricosum]